MAMRFLFWRRKTLEEMLRKSQRALTKTLMDLDREVEKMEQQEKRIVNDLKKMLIEGRNDTAEILAIDVARTRRYVKELNLTRRNIQEASVKIQRLRSQNAMAQAEKGVTKAMQKLIKELNLPPIQKIMQEFENQREMMDEKEETINDAMGDDEDGEESRATLAKGLDLTDKLQDLPSTGGTLSAGQSTDKQPLADVDADLQERLENLRVE